MKKPYLSLLAAAIACLYTIQASAGRKISVFFIGNSYTYTNDLPKMIADIATSMGDTLVYDGHTPGGWKFSDHWGGAPSDPCISKVKTGNWNYVIFQEQSQMPAISESTFWSSTYKYAESFNKLIRDSAQCTVPVFYMTWGYKDGDAANCPGFPHMCTYGSMDSVLRSRYLQMADSFDAVVSPVGAVRRYLRQYHPALELYQADGSHPSVTGTYAAACCFYAALFKKDPSLIPFNSSLSATDATTVKAAAKKVTYDSLAKWGFDAYDLTPAYDYGISGTKVTFTNRSSAKALTYSWDFGDGNTSALKDPVHTYAAKGNYTVTLTVYDAKACSRVITQNVNLSASGIIETERATFTLMPNPATDVIMIRHNQQAIPFHILITNTLGQIVYHAPAQVPGTTHTIDLSAFPRGLYTIVLYNEAATLYRDKLMKR